MFRSPVAFTHPLSQETILSNGEIIADLFTSEICNRDSTSRFSDILGAQIKRDSDDELQFQSVMAENAQKLGIDPVFVKISKEHFLQTLSDVLTHHGIALDPNVVKNNPEAQEQRKLLFPYFRAILFVDANERDAAVIESSDLSPTTKEYARELAEKRMRSPVNDQAAFIQKIQVMQYMISIKAFGDGDCFYHSVMLDIVHDILTGSLEDESLTGKQIKAQLLPAIAAQIASRGGPQLDFSDQTLHASILDLLRAAPVASLPHNLSATLTLPAASDESEELIAVKNCDFYHLLRDTCAPALRQIMLNGALARQDAIEDDIRNILKNNFIAYTIRNHGGELNFDPSIVETAKLQWASSEFSDIPEAQSRNMLASWNNVYLNIKLQSEFTALTLSDDDAKKDFLGRQFDNWWDQYHDHAYKDYFNFHAHSHIKAGTPQQLALSSQLQCNLDIVDRRCGNLAPITPEIHQAHTLHLDNRPDHFDAIVGDPRLEAPTQIAVALNERTRTLNECKSTLQITAYNWPAKVPDTDLDPIHSLAASAERPLSESVGASQAVTLEAVVESTRKAQETIASHAKELSETLGLNVDSIPQINIDDVSLTETDTSDKLAKNLLIAASTGYKAALKHTTFGNSLERLNTSLLDVRSKQEADDLLLAIELQNQEIQKYFKR
ncbi:hypothetical protein AQUSIP_19680 [Aquicella siphonis]|uniref:OTU domain-containing protein n=1 Tax=Aquicella siphonis TaxID=254247 RepID=A0A5E4PJ95_9COXI|nr:hypothetical protein [Aquicella siphonis]VVC76645.1 hypothetical protein AQUSIP_19680 [Aquicella siphonis]